MSFSNISAFLLGNRFSLIEREMSDYFGDTYEVFSNGSLQFRLVVDKSYFSVELCSACNPSTWFDLSVVASLFNENHDLKLAFTALEYELFLRSNLNAIIDLFNADNCFRTNQRLKELSNTRDTLRHSTLFPPKRNKLD